MKATIYLIIATSLWGFNFHFSKLVLREVEFLEGGLWRYICAVSILVILSFNKLPSVKVFKENLKEIVAVGIVIFLFNVLFFWGMKTTSGINGALIMGINPTVTLILSHFILKTPIKRNHIFGISLALFGVLYLLLKGNISDITSLSFSTGDLLVLIAISFFALHHVWVKKYSKPTVSNQEFTTMVAIVALFCFILISPFSGIPNVSNHSQSFWIGAIGIGCLGTGISYLFWYKGIQLIGANKAGVFVNLVPLSAGLSATFFGEHLNYYHFISGALIILGLIVMQVTFSKRKNS